METISFISGTFAHRLNFGGGRHQLLPKAIGLHKRTDLQILDCTAGLGRDGFLLAHLGATVTLLERHPAVYTALQAALTEAKPVYPNTVARLHLHHQDAIHYTPDTVFDVVYLDPIFPEKSKSALSKKGLRNLKTIVGTDPDADQLFHAAKQFNSKRIVVKRPKLASFLANEKPSYQVSGKSSRFDVYVK